MITLLIYPQIVRVMVENEYDDIDKIIRDSLAYATPGARHIRKNKLQQAKALNNKDDIKYWSNWDGMTSPYKNHEFPIGFLWRVGLLLRAKRYKVTVNDRRSKPKELPNGSRPIFNGKLRPYQVGALEKMLAEQRGMVNIATGGGKTIIALALLEKRPLKTFIIVPTIDLVTDWFSKTKQFLKFGDSQHHIGYAQGQQYDLDTITIINVQSLHNALFRRTTHKRTVKKYEAIKKAYMEADMLIVDECHHASSPTWKKVIMQSNAYYRYGLSATIDMRSDKTDIEYYGMLGEKISIIGASELIMSGDISPATVVFTRWGYKYFIPPIDYLGDGGVEDMGIVFNSERNNLIVEQSFSAYMTKGKRTMVMFRRLDHGKILYELLKRHYAKNNHMECRIELVHGKHKQRKEITQDFRDGKVHILIAQNQILSEGIDVPDIACVVMAAGGKSPIKLIQSFGRGIRNATGKVDLLIYDYADEGRYMEKHSRKRLETYAAESAFEITADDTILQKRLEHIQLVDGIF